MEEDKNSSRQNKVSEQLRRTAADFLEIESNKKSLITVTRAAISKNLKEATIFITVLPESYETTALNFTRRNAGEFREYTKSKMKLRILPFFSFEIDKGEKTRQKIDELGNKK
ncbi:MAG: ribosome-binding factor A [Patescibacteria group bacterium]